jgi:hypothetical protein
MPVPNSRQRTQGADVERAVYCDSVLIMIRAWCFILFIHLLLCLYKVILNAILSIYASYASIHIINQSIFPLCGMEGNGAVSFRAHDGFG